MLCLLGLALVCDGQRDMSAVGRLIYFSSTLDHISEREPQNMKYSHFAGRYNKNILLSLRRGFTLGAHAQPSLPTALPLLHPFFRTFACWALHSLSPQVADGRPVFGHAVGFVRQSG